MDGTLQIIALGGSGDIGKNMLAFRYDDTILVVDGHEILNFGRQSIPIYEVGGSLNAGPHGCMGIGVPFGIGAKAVGGGGDLRGEGGH